MERAAWREAAEANADEDSQEEAGSDQEEGEEEEEEDEIVLLFSDESPRRSIFSEDEDEADMEEEAEIKERLGMIHVEQEKALRMIRVEQKKCGTGELCAFDFLSFTSYLVREIGRDIRHDISWEANALAIAYHLLEAYMIELLRCSNLNALNSCKFFVGPEDVQVARVCRRFE